MMVLKLKELALISLLQREVTFEARMALIAELRPVDSPTVESIEFWQFMIQWLYNETDGMDHPQWQYRGDLTTPDQWLKHFRVLLFHPALYDLHMPVGANKVIVNNDISAGRARRYSRYANLRGLKPIEGSTGIYVTFISRGRKGIWSRPCFGDTAHIYVKLRVTIALANTKMNRFRFRAEPAVEFDAANSHDERCELLIAQIMARIDQLCVRLLVEDDPADLPMTMSIWFRPFVVQHA